MHRLRISYHRKLQLLWLWAHLFLIYAIFVDFNFANFLVGLVFTFFVNIGSEAGAHRYFSHRSFTTTPIIERALVILQTFAGEGSVLAFCGVHRQHHAFSDQPQDPHSPKHKSWLSITFWLSTIHVNPKFVRDCLQDKIIRWQHFNYFRIHFILSLIAIFILGPVSYGYFFCMPIVLILYGNALTNIVGHCRSVGYRNFETEDQSINVGGLINVLLMGGGMQNNHHAHPTRASMKFRDSEHDSMGWIIENFLVVEKSK